MITCHADFLQSALELLYHERHVPCYVAYCSNAIDPSMLDLSYGSSDVIALAPFGYKAMREYLNDPSLAKSQIILSNNLRLNVSTYANFDIISPL